VVDLVATYPVTGFATVTLAVENLLDKAWRVHGSGQNEPGLNLSLTLELRF
jgi:hemoglobin/transferrin/lactoferrin receptor protein